MKRRVSLFQRFLNMAAPTWREELIEALLVGGATASGMNVNAETAMRIGTVHACVRILSDAVASLPLQIYRRLDAGGRERATSHPLYELLHTRPNPWQSSMDWRSQMMDHLLLRGNYYAAILRHGDDIVDDLIPFNPDAVNVEQLPDYTLRYKVRRPGGDQVTLEQRDMLHIRGLSSNGFTGRGVIQDAREMFGSALATQEYAARLFSQDATPGIVLKTKGKITGDGAIERLRETWEGGSMGVRNSHRTRILEDGMEIDRLSMTAEDSQFIETRKMQRSEIAALFGVPLFLLQANEVTATYASAEQFMLSFVTHSVRPWLVRIEQALHNQLFTAPRAYFPEHNMDGILRADIKTRYEAYKIALDTGILSKNEARSKENENPIEGGDDHKSVTELQNAKVLEATGGAK